ncbi:hypothetical protein DSO57_1033757 [Entomophthora muscae]|uniref:Uncharacterized protein n=1 Tax=Entomophthora muscae TaxID=34485 RepID=A0ACC2TMF6_9FUNG|nr:hypothetical protein DSO57_1033757 [Entomophthora muscae]
MFLADIYQSNDIVNYQWRDLQNGLPINQGIAKLNKSNISLLNTPPPPRPDRAPLQPLAFG